MMVAAAGIEPAPGVGTKTGLPLWLVLDRLKVLGYVIPIGCKGGDRILVKPSGQCKCESFRGYPAFRRSNRANLYSTADSSESYGEIHSSLRAPGVAVARFERQSRWAVLDDSHRELSAYCREGTRRQSAHYGCGGLPW